jgi:hypothetical protein
LIERKQTSIKNQKIKLFLIGDNFFFLAQQLKVKKIIKINNNVVVVLLLFFFFIEFINHFLQVVHLRMLCVIISANVLSSTAWNWAFKTSYLYDVWRGHFLVDISAVVVLNIFLP